ncbi:hypothetical protein [Nocardia sp. XZ_19_231]|uniref:hypothetical protein n=1 Tax=Nocardia sp. XZ_19_231 TaxID=2769252 RepID=UPI00188F105B|nr:hypothetical protein [Nocardia sp. XZ_19_231]
MRRILVAAISLVSAAAFLTIIVAVAVWPGEAKLTAPLFCSSPATEPVVVSDTFHDSEGTSTNYTLYCVSDRGVLTDEGFALPMLVLFAAHVVILGALLLLTALLGRLGHRPDRSDGPFERVQDS